MWITLGVRISVMDAMCYDPLDGAAFKRERATDTQKILHQLWRLVAPMRQEPVKAHPHSQAGGNPPKQDGGHQRAPIEYKERGHRPDMKKNHEYRGIPFNTLAAFANHCFVNHCFVAPFELSKSSFHLYGANRASTFVECRARRPS